PCDVPHRPSKAGDLGGGLAFGPQGQKDRAGVLVGRLATGQRQRQGLGRVACEVFASLERLQVLLHEPPPVGGGSRRKFARSVRPSGVRTLSGWNCTPSIGRERWRIPMISPVSERAVASSSGGIDDSTTASEWYRPAISGLGAPAKSVRPSWRICEVFPCKSRCARSTRAPNMSAITW